MKVWIASSVMQEMCRHAAELSPLETGGIMLGWRSGNDCVVADMRGPGLAALHGRYNFLPDHSWQIAEIRAAFAATRGDLDYLGDWHSHPQGVAAMSSQDDTTLRKIARRVTNPLMLILADTREGSDWTAACWKFSRKRTMWPSFEPQAQELKLFEAPHNWPKPLLSLY